MNYSNAAIWRIYRLSRSGKEAEIGHIVAASDRTPYHMLRDTKGCWLSRRDPAPLAYDRIKKL